MANAANPGNPQTGQFRPHDKDTAVAPGEKDDALRPTGFNREHLAGFTLESERDRTATDHAVFYCGRTALRGVHSRWKDFAAIRALDLHLDEVIHASAKSARDGMQPLATA